MYMEEFDDTFEKTTISPNSNKFIYLVIILLVIISLIVSYFVLFKDFFKDRYTKMEESMIASAEQYVINNNISTDKEIYFDVSDLSVNVDSDCYITSGVIFDGKDYTANLMCKEYKSKIIVVNDQVTDFITLRGEEVIVLAKGVAYIEHGYKSNDIVQILGEVGTENGVYNLFYKTINSNSIARRKIIIIDKQIIKDLFPVINLIGNEIVYLVKGNEYVEPGIVAKDTVDGVINNQVEIEGFIDNEEPGEYIIDYSITNSRGYKNIVKRKVNVIDNESDLEVDYTISPNTMTNENVTIKFTTSGDFLKIVYPDGTEGKDLQYVAKQNGIYNFSIYDIHNRVINKEIKINNIDKTVPQGICTAKAYYNRTEISVKIDTKREISSYTYYINGSKLGSNQSNTFVSSVTKPALVKVVIKDSINNQNELTCSIENNTTRKIVTDAKGKNCLEGLTCYVQFDYGNSSKYPYCSMANNPNSCGGIGRNGCSITSATNVIAAMGVKSKTGVLHNPYTVWSELYPINKNTGQCGGGCSGWTRIRDSVINAGLSAERKVISVNNSNKNKIIEHLRKGYPVIVWADTGAFTDGRHYMSLLGVREDGYVFLSDSANRSGTYKKTYNGRKYYVDTWIPYDDLISGRVKDALLVGPKGVYEGK